MRYLGGGGVGTVGRDDSGIEIWLGWMTLSSIVAGTCLILRIRDVIDSKNLIILWISMDNCNYMGTPKNLSILHASQFNSK